MVQNATKQEFRFQWSGSGVFVATQLRGTNFCTSSEHFAPSFVRQLNSPKCTQMVQNVIKQEFRVQWGGSGAFVSKIPVRLRAMNICTSSEHFAPSLVRKPSGPKWYETHQNMSSGSNGVDRVRSFWKISMRLYGSNFCTSSVCFAPSFVRQPNARKCTQTVWNTPKHEFRVNGVDRVVRREKFWRDFVAQTFALVWPLLHWVS